METVEFLRDGTKVVIRSMKADDFERSWTFFQALPAEDRRYLRVDVTKRDLVERRVREADSDRVKRIVAVVDDHIVGDGALELAGVGWTAHVGELRLIIAHDFQRRGLGMLMARELHTLAAKEKVEQVVVQMARPQVGARRIFEHLGFQEELTIPKHVRDQTGHRQDLVLMRCDLEALWQKLESFLAASDWQRTR